MDVIYYSPATRAIISCLRFGFLLGCNRKADVKSTSKTERIIFGGVVAHKRISLG